MRRTVGIGLVLVLLCAVPFVAGCGGSAGGNPPTLPQGGTITGSVGAAGGGTEYDVLLNGQVVPGAMQADGTFVIEGVPPGEHRVAIIERNGMGGGYTTVVVNDGEETEVPEIIPTLGGQIVGMVTVEDGEGLRALAGVKVTAVPNDMVIIMSRPADGDTEPTIYPPPPLPEFSAFSEEDGSYRIRAVPQGEYTVTVAAPGYTEGWQWVWVEAGYTAVADFRLRPYIDPGVGTVEGQVLGVTDDKATVPIEGAMVTVYCDVPWEPIGPPIYREDGEPGTVPGVGGDGAAGDDGVIFPEPTPDMPPPWFYGLSALTDADGRYRLQVPAGYGSIEVWADGFEGAWEEIVIEADQVLTKNFLLQQWTWEEPPFPEPVPMPEPLPPNRGR